MLRIGIVGTENSHADVFVRHLNVEWQRADARVVALAGGETEKNKRLAEQGEIGVVVNSLGDVIGDIDAAVVCNRHGGLHREHAVPLLEAGKHVFVDKPTATTVADVEAMIDASRSGGAVLASWSIVRHARGVPKLRASAVRSRPAVVAFAGPADPHSEHAGLFFYGPHVVEPALEILGNPSVLDDVTVHMTDDAVTAITQVGGTQLVLTFVRPEDGGPIPWHGTVAGHGEFTDQVITGDDLDHGSGLNWFIDAALTGQQPVSYEQLIGPVSLLTAITEKIDLHS